MQDQAWSVRDAPEVSRLLELARTHLGTDVAFVSEFERGDQVIRLTSGDAASMHLEAGTAGPMSGSYCVRVLSGAIPAVIPHARRHPVTRELPATRAQNIGSYVGAPLRGPDGVVEGMVCALSRHADPALDDTSATFLGLVADLISDHLSTPAWVARRARHAGLQRVTAIVADQDVRTVFQPVVDLDTGRTVAYEALSRFAEYASPDLAFAEAGHVGLGVELELVALRRALASAGRVPDDALLAVNLSAEALASEEVRTELLRHAHRRLAVEVTEHTPVVDYPALRSVVADLRAAGVLVAVDDAGAGYASLQHVLQLGPDIIKLDAELVRHVDTDLVRQALTRSLLAFADDVGARLVAEGVETAAELATLRRLGVHLAQGFLLGRPGDLPDESATTAPAVTASR